MVSHPLGTGLGAAAGVLAINKRLFASISVSIIASQTRVPHLQVIAIEQGSTPWRRTETETSSFCVFWSPQASQAI